MKIKKEPTPFIIAIDFDNTIVEEKYPEIGELRKYAGYYINKLYEDGYKILINTCRAEEYQDHAETFLREKGIKFHQINNNLPESIAFYKQDCRKLSAHLYIDDRCLMGLPETWGEIYKMVKEKAKKHYGKQ